MAFELNILNLSCYERAIGLPYAVGLNNDTGNDDKNCKRNISTDTTVTQDTQYSKEEEERGQQKEEKEKAASLESSTHSLSHVLYQVG